MKEITMEAVYVIGVLQICLIALAALSAYEIPSLIKEAQDCHKEYQECLKHSYLQDIAKTFRQLEIGNYILVIKFGIVPIIIGVLLFTTR